MQNFDYYNPTQVLFGQGQIARLTELVPSDVRVLLLYGGGSIKKNGVYEQIKRALHSHQVLEFGGIEANPSYETMMRAVAMIRQENIGFLLAAGGGSVIDGAKFAAAAAVFPQELDPWQILEKWGNNVRAALPLGCVLTLPATGSETNCGSVITHTASKTKRSFMNRLVFPRFAILDPSTTFSLPLRQIGNGVVDSFIHVIEQYLTVPGDAPLQDRAAEGVLLTLIEEGPKVLAEPENYAVRANLMWAASLALNGQLGVGVVHDWATHVVGHELTALFGLDHAQTLAIVLPGMLRVRKQKKHAKLLQYASRVWQLQDGDEEQRIDQAIIRTEAFFQKMGVPTRLQDYGLGQAAIESIIAALQDHKMVMLGEDRSVTPEVCRAALEMQR